MAQIDQGPATGNGVFVFGPSGASVEVHVASGQNSLAPSDQNNLVHPRAASTLQTQVSKALFLGGTCNVKFLNPA